MKLDRNISRGRVGPLAAATLVLIGVLAPPGAAQRRPPGMFEEKFEPRLVVEPYSGSAVHFEWDSEQDDLGDQAARIVAATILAGGGLFVGSYSGLYLGDACGCYNWYDWLYAGALVGSSVFSALATRPTKDGGGGLGRSVGKNLLVSAAALAAFHATGVGEFLLVAPILHVAFAVQ